MKTQRIMALVIVALAAVACGGGNSTPTKAFQTYYQALKNKDVKAFKSVMSKAMLEKGEKVAQQRNTTVDALLKASFEGGMSKVPDQMPEYKDEKIAADGKTATLEVKDPDSDRWQTLYFMKEDDGWKIDPNKEVRLSGR